MTAVMSQDRFFYEGSTQTGAYLGAPAINRLHENSAYTTKVSQSEGRPFAGSRAGEGEQLTCVSIRFLEYTFRSLLTAS